MKRREFLVSAVAAGAVGSMAAQAAPMAAAPWPRESICRAPKVQSTALAGDQHLVFEGTHILAYGAMRQMARAYRGRIPLLVRGGGCDNAVMSVRLGSAHLGGMCCPPEGPRLEGLASLVVANDIKVVVVHPDMAINDIAMEDLRAIADGSLTDWRALGCGHGPIAQVIREHCDDFAEPVRTMLLPTGPAWSAVALKVPSDQNIVDTVARFPRAMGVASWAFAKPLVAAGRLKVLAVDGVRPAHDAVRDRRYGLIAPLSLIYSAWRPEMTPFFDFLYGHEGRAIIADRLVPISADEAGYRPA